MNNTNKTIVTIFSLLILPAVLACGIGDATPAVMVPPTRTPAPTFTATSPAPPPSTPTPGPTEASVPVEEGSENAENNQPQPEPAESPTDTPIPPTNTPEPEPTNTPEPPAPEPVAPADTPVPPPPPTDTPVPQPSGPVVGQYGISGKVIARDKTTFSAGEKAFFTYEATNHTEAPVSFGLLGIKASNGQFNTSWINPDVVQPGVPFRHDDGMAFDSPGEYQVFLAICYAFCDGGNAVWEEYPDGAATITVQ